MERLIPPIPRAWIPALSLGLTLLGPVSSEGGTGTPRIDPRDPRRFVMDAEPWVPLGYTPGLGALTLRRDGTPLEDFYRAYHDWLRERRINYYRAVFSFGQAFEGRKTEETLPYLRLGPGRAVDGKLRFDLDRFDPSHFEYWRRVIRDAGEKGIVVQLVLFDSWHLNQADRGNGWGRILDPYYGKNNVNGVTFDLEDEASWHRSESSSAVYRRQQALVDEVVEELGSLPNLVWEIANEPAEFLDSWAVPLARYLRARDRGRHLVIPLDLPDHQHTPGLYPPEHLPQPTRRALMERFPEAIPLIVHNDTTKAFLPPALQREKAWAVLTAGAHFNYFTNREEAVPLRRSHSPESRGARFIGHLRAFLQAFEVDLRAMEPADGRVRPAVAGGAWCLGRGAREMIVYKRALPGNGWVDVLGPPQRYRARWFNPRSGRPEAATAQGRPVAGAHRFHPPRQPGKDWVLHLEAGGG